MTYYSDSSAEVAPSAIPDSRATLRAIKNGEVPAREWPDALPLHRQLDAPMPYPTSALGDIFGDAAMRIHEVTGAESAIAGQSVMSAIFVAVQAHANLIIDGRTSPISNYFATLASSGDRKSGADRAALAKHKEHQMHLMSEHDERLSRFNNSHELYDTARQKIINDKSKNLGAQQAAIVELGDEPIAPRSPVFLIDDTTGEGITRSFEEGSPSAGWYSEEGGKSIGGYSLKAENKLRMGALLSGTWDGEPISCYRGGSGGRLLYNRRLSMHLLLQPGVALDFLNDSTLIDQGLFSRMLVSYPRLRPVHDYVAVDLSKDSIMQTYYQRINTILLQEPRLHSNPRMGLDLRNVHFSRAAYKSWVLFHNDTERWRQPDGKYGRIFWLTAKSAEHVGRIAAALTLAENICATEIGANHLESAIAIMTHHLDETSRIVGASGQSAWLALAQECLQFLRKQSADADGVIVFKPALLYQKGPNAIRTSRKSRQIISTLEEHGCVRTYGDGTKELWEVRPADV